ncbi:sigma factor-like helix-turn-helix DNA-binding protein [uncultured Arthrobacter sp.]|uniref:sigma factor-like helix-turn-helix DNA-binding protein n=1 Tax=uncultured Arthrobacter sp. TaxID=114050 RepID=UPI0025F91F32|nr:sigma factor-like helix-turn-helix DNA-binding protein [uncultured Arthrobacter sp.]
MSTETTSQDTNPTCATCTDQLTSFQSGLLPEYDRETVSEHLTTCPQCRIFVDQVDQSRRLLASAPPPEPPVDVSRRIAEEFASSSATTDISDIVARLHRLAMTLGVDDPDDLVQRTLLAGLERRPEQLGYTDLAHRLVESASTSRATNTTVTEAAPDPDLLDVDSEPAELYFPDFYEEGPDLGRHVDSPNVWGRTDELSPDEDYETGELYEAADQAMDQLPAQTRQLIQLVDVEGFSLTQAAAGLDLDEESAARELNRGRIHVRGALDLFLTGG